MKILLIEDEVHLSEALTQILKNNSFEVDCAFDGKTGLQRTLLEQHDLILLDIMLPGLSGLEILKRLRKSDTTTPVILITARNDVSDKILGLDYGADDYLPKPFNTDELLARIRANLRKNAGSVESNELKYGDVTLSKNQLKLTSDSGSISLSKKESELFDYFFKNNSIVVPFEKIAEKLAIKDELLIEERTNDYISILKNKLNHIKSAVNILTINGLGYKLVSPTGCNLWGQK